MDNINLEDLNLEDMSEEQGIKPGSESPEGPTPEEQLALIPVEDIVQFLKDKEVLPIDFEIPAEFTSLEGADMTSAGMRMEGEAGMEPEMGMEGMPSLEDMGPM